MQVTTATTEYPYRPSVPIFLSMNHSTSHPASATA